MSNVLRQIIFFVMIVFLSTLSTVFVFAQTDVDTITPDNVIEFVNKERLKNNLEPLKENELLGIVAQKKLDNMIEENYFAHTSPEGVDPWKWFFDAGYDFAYAGENLAIDYTDVIKQHTAWMNSTKHKQNILDDRFTHTGVAVGHENVDGKDVIVTVEVFATPQKASITPSNFTPDTFEVPDSLFYKGAKDLSIKKDVTDIKQKIPVLQADSVKKKLQEKSKIHILAWLFIGLLVLIVFWLEYHIFFKK